MSNFHAKPADSALRELHSEKLGITPAEAKKRLSQYGKNELITKKKKSLASKFLSQLADFSIIILLFAAALSYVVSYIGNEQSFTDTAVILAIVILNAVIGMLQESKAERSLDALKKLSAPEAKVLRAGREYKIPAYELVPGDILLLSAGDMVGADARLISSHSLATDESALTGESVASKKDFSAVLHSNAPTADKKNTVFSSTLVVSGRGEAVVYATGMNTEIGKIAGMLGTKEEETPLQKKLSSLSKVLGVASLICCAVVFAMGLFRKSGITESFILAVSLAVAAIPEGLPAIVTVVLSRGVGALAKKNAVIRHLPSCETLGNATVICSDKTGTLTQNKMTVTEVFLPGKGIVKPDDSACADILKYAALCTDVTVRIRGKSKSVSGEPTETAIVNAALGNGYSPKTDNAVYKRVREIPFDSTRKMMTTIHRTQNGYISITKGSPEALLKICTHIKTGSLVREASPGALRLIENANKTAAGLALRVLGVAVRECGDISLCGENALTFIGLIAMEDPPRKEAFSAVKKCRDAGITPVMITGDQLLTAEKTAEKLGILESGQLSVDGSRLDSMSDAQLKECLSEVRVFARVTPEHKMRIVKAYRECGETVAMTGDGVNDAPALKAADIGCAMGKSGTDVAKNAADMILTDDNFSTIVNAVEIGRGLFDNIKKSVRFLLSCNIGEIMLVFSASVLGLPSPLIPVQLLWLNLVTDSLPAIALGTEKPEKDIMKRAPSKKNESIIPRSTAFDIAVEGMLFGAFALFAFVFGKNTCSLEAGRTMAFCTLSISEIFHALNIRTEKSVFCVSPFDNPFLSVSTVICIALQAFSVIFPFSAGIFGTTPLTINQWLTVGLLSLMPLFVAELEKLITRIKNKKKATAP